MPPYNGSGSASAASGGSYPASGNTVIESGKFNTLIADLITMLSTCLLKDGQQVATARIPFAQGISVDDIDEKTSNTGVNIDGLLIKDSAIADTNGNEALLVGTTGSAVNEFTITNAATGNRPRLAATGGDTNIGVSIRPKGTGSGAAVVLEDGNGNEIIIAGPAVASAVNEVTVTNAATGGAPVISATGGDTNIPLRLTPKGTGDVQFTDGTDTTKIASFELSGITTATTRTYTLPNASGTLKLSNAQPTRQIFTSGSGTYTTPAGATRILVRILGGGGGGGAQGGTNGSAGGNTTFSTLTANGGGGGNTAVGNYATGGTASGGDININGQTGSPGGSGPMSGHGASSIFGVGGTHVYGSGVTLSGIAGVGYGAGGSGNAVNGGNAGSGGASGGYSEKLITSPSSTYSYAVGAAGAGGTGGTSSTVGGAGGAGIVIVDEFYD